MLHIICFLFILHVVTSTDPCLASKLINDVGNRGTNCIPTNSKLICDRNGFDPGWYSAVYNGDHLEIPTSCPGVMACGTGSPIWIYGTYPSSVGETVNTTACVRGFKQADTCIATYRIEIKKCSGFYVYKLPYVDLCYSAFCFGNHTCESKLTTDKKEPEPDHSMTTTALPQTEPCIHATQLPDMHKRGSECSSVNLEKQLCDRQFTTGWYKGVDNKVFYNMPTYCVDVAACGTDEPIWLNGSLPTFADGIVQRKACVRGFASNDCCKKKIDIQIRNCFTYNVYYLSYTDLCYRAYCFGERGCIKENPDTDLVEDPEEGSMSKSAFVVPYLLSGFLFSVLLIGVCVFIVFLKTKRMRISNAKEFIKTPPPPYSPPCYKKGFTSGVIETISVDKKTTN